MKDPTESIASLRGGLIVSCQAVANSPLRDSKMMAAMAQAALLGGAVGIRANGPEDIAAIRAKVELPVIGIFKMELPGFEPYITPTLPAARLVAQAGADLIALDATLRPHPEGLSAADLIAAVKASTGLPVMADISTLEEGQAAARAGADLVATTLTGYTPYTRHISLPDFDLIRRLVASISVPVVVEGHISTPGEARKALDLGAHAVVVGAAITQPEYITQRFVQAMQAV